MTRTGVTGPGGDLARVAGRGKDEPNKEREGETATTVRTKPKFNMRSFVYPTGDRNDKTGHVFDSGLSTPTPAPRPRIPEPDRSATTTGAPRSADRYTLVDAYRTFTVGIIYPYTTAGVLYTVSPKPVGTARPAIILHRAVEQRGAARAEPLQRSSRRSSPDGSARASH